MAILTDGKTKVKVSSESEEETVDNTVAQHPVQRGAPMIDTTQRNSRSWDIEGKIFGKDQADIDKTYNKLISWQFRGTLLTYTGAVRFSDLLISNLTKTYDEGGFKNAVKFTATLTEVKIATTSFIGKKNTGPKTPTKAKAAKKGGTYVTVKSGDTYWGFAQKYGISIPTLRGWNKYPDRKIPIGVKVRVK